MFTDAEPPTEEAFRLAIAGLGDKLTELQRRIFAIHFSLPARAMTSQRLRDELGYTGIAASNGAYGKLGHLIADAVGFDPQSTAIERRGWWRSISTGDDTGENFVWFMRPQLAEALVSLNLVDSYTDGTVDLIDPDIPDTLSVVEGRLRLRSHLARERSRSLVAAKRESVSDRRCEVCGFSSLETYGVDYCEVHHLTPLAQLDGVAATRLEDLAIVCANCHRIILMTSQPLTLDQLRNKLTKA
jgi:predicted HNH restriction endonuclease